MLAGKRIVITREQPGEFADKLREHGAIPIHIPLIEIIPILPNPALDDALSRLDTFVWAIFTSANAVRFTIKSGDLAGWKNLKIAAVGNKTAEALRTLGLAVDLIPEEQNAASLTTLIPTGQRVLIPQAEQPAFDFPIENAQKVAVYRTALTSPTPDQIAQIQRVDAITLASPSAVQSLVKYVGVPGSVKIVCIGKTTAQAATLAGLTVHAIAAQPSSEGLIAALQTIL